MLKTAHLADGTTHKRHMGGWLKQRTDARDEAYRLKLHPLFAATPPSSDNRPFCSPVVDQGELGSCTANAFSALIESNEIRRIGPAKTNPHASAAVAAAQIVGAVTTDAHGNISFMTRVSPATPAPTPPSPTPTPTPTPPPAPPKPAVLERVSRLFEYYGTRKIEGTINDDAGASIRDAIKCGALYGVADEALYPYDITKFAATPAPTIWTAAATHKVTSYHAISDGDINTMKAVLAAGSLIEFGFSVYDSFMTAAMASTGLMPMPAPGEQVQGGHAVALVGHDDTKQIPGAPVGAFLVRNSWGTGWGVAGSGYFWMPYAFVADTNQCSDFWVITSAPI